MRVHFVWSVLLGGKWWILAIMKTKGMVICKDCFIRSICVLYYSCAWSVGIVFSWEAAGEECELLTHLEIEHVSAKCWRFLLCFHNSNFSEWKGSHLPLIRKWLLLPLRKAGFSSRKTCLAFSTLHFPSFPFFLPSTAVSSCSACAPHSPPYFCLSS